MNIWWTLHLRRDAASVPLARRILLGTMESVGVERQVCDDISVALTEACANVIEHAGSGATPDEYQVTVSIDGHRCGVEVVDFGFGFAPDDTPSTWSYHHAETYELTAGQGQEGFLTDAALLGEVPWTETTEPQRPATVDPRATPATPAAPADASAQDASAQDASDETRRTERATREHGPQEHGPQRGPAEPGPSEHHQAEAAERLALLPPDLSAEHGRGLFLIRSLVDHVQFTNHPCRGAVVSFDKVLRWRDEKLLRAS